MVIGASGLAVGGLYAGGAFDRGEVYNVPIAEARMRLELMEMPVMVLSAAGGSTVSESQNGDVFTWKAMAGTKTSAVFTATLKDEGPGRTRVTLDYDRKDSGDEMSDRLLSTNFMRSMSETSFHEHVDAAIENRKPDDSRAMHEFAMHAAAHPEDVRELGLATEGIFRDVAEQLKTAQSQGDIERYLSQYSSSNSPSVRMEAATRPNPDATRPSTQLPRN